MPRQRPSPATPGSRRRAAKTDGAHAAHDGSPRLVIITGLSGSGKASTLKAFEDLGYYSVDNLPLDLLPAFADLVRQSGEIERAALVVDVREGERLDKFPQILARVRRVLPTRVLYLEASNAALLRRFSETRRPHPLGRSETVGKAIDAERRLLAPIRNVADETLDTSRHNVHELRAFILSRFERGSQSSPRDLLVSVLSFGYRNGVPLEADLVFDVRFLPNPHFVPEFRSLTGKHPKVAKYVRQFPQTAEFLTRTMDMLLFLLPHYVQEGKSYLTIAIGCTGGQHRSVMIAEEIRRRLAKAGYRVKGSHRDLPR